MEQKDIVFDKGIHREPTVSLSDAELSECVNLMPSHGELVNMKPAEDISVQLADGERLLAIHKTSDGQTHYITKRGSYIYCLGNNTSLASATNIKQVVAVGNALALIYDNTVETPTPMKYLLWKNGSYTLLEDMPDVRMDFSLSGEYHQETYTNSVEFVKASEDPTAYGPEICVLTSTQENNYVNLEGQSFTAKGLANDTDYYLKNNSQYIVAITTGDGSGDNTRTIKPGMGISMQFKDSKVQIRFPFVFSSTGTISVSVSPKNTSIVDDSKVLKSTLENYTAMMGDVKNYIHRVYTTNNKFIFPFFVRYGVKLFDGSYCHISEPILMIPNTEIAPVMVNTASNTVTCASFIADLYAKISLDTTELEKWKDIITGVTIAISNPIYRINLGEEWDQYKIQGEVKNYNSSSLNRYWGYYNDTYNQLWDSLRASITSANLLYLPPSFTREQYEENVKSTSVFYVAKTFSLEDIKKVSSSQSKSIKIDFSAVKLDNLSTLPVLPDDYNSSNKFYPSGAFAYNNRLNIFDIKETLAKPFNPCGPLISNNTDCICVFFVSNKDREIIVSTGEINGDPGGIKWIYYGNPQTTKCRIYQHCGGVYNYCDITMAKHPWLNGAYAYISNTLSWTECSSSDYQAYVSASSGVIRNNNAIYASNASNPFFFGVNNQNLIGTGKINSVSTAAKALSQGQFGQFPLYAFTDDGIWSLSVDGEGKYSTSNPINRDVVTNIKSICQIDDSVIYACSQGLKQLAGSETKLLTETISGHNISEAQFLTQDSGVDDNHLGLVDNDTDSIVKMAENCMVMYDPSGKRLIHVYPQTPNGKHYVYDLDSEEWSTEVSSDSNVVAIVPGYPYSTFEVTVINAEDNTENNKLMQYNNTENNTIVRYGLLLTREFAAGDPFAMKMLHDLRLIYSNNNNNDNVKCKVAVFVSNDRKSWKKLTSLRKHSYKWYRFRIQTALTDLDALTSMSLRMEERRTNKMR